MAEYSTDEDIFVCSPSFGQERLWFLDQFAPGSPAYIVSFAFQVEGRLDVAALRRSLTALVGRHESLCTTFATHEGRLLQIVALPPDLIALPLIDLSGLPAPAQEAQILALPQHEARRPFDLAHGPLFRATLIRRAATTHILLLTLHHIVFDEWSFAVLARDLAAFYAAERTGQPAVLPEMPIQYADYAAWQRDWLQGDIRADLERYWLEQLALAPPLLVLPTACPRPPIQSFAGANHTFTLPPALFAAVYRLCHETDTTLFMTLLAAFQTLLARYTGQDDILVATPVANRTQSETADLIGFLVNTLVLRTDLSGSPTVRELLLRVREVALGAYAHHELPFEQLIERLQLARTPSYPPLAQVLFSVDRVAGPPALDGLRVERLRLPQTTSKFDLSLVVEEDAQGLQCELLYNTDLFATETMTRLGAHYTMLLSAMVATPDRSIAALPLCTPAERSQLCRPAGMPNRSLPAPSLPAAVQHHAHSTPDTVAVVAGDQHLTYAVLIGRATALAQCLRACGIGPGVAVGLLVPRSLDLAIGVVGILLAGGAYLPLDPTAPPERLAWMLRDSQTPVLVTYQSMHSTHALAAEHVLYLDALPPAPPTTLPATDAAELAYIIYTSGSTGTPKGVLVPQRNVLRLFAAAPMTYSRDDTWTLFHALSFDFSVWELWGALLYGGRLVVVPYLVSRDPYAFWELLLQQGVTVLNQTPSAFQQLQAVAVTGPERLHALRYVIFGGEALEPARLQAWVARYGDAQPELINMYGITETTVHVTVQRLTAALVASEGISAIGGPLADLELYVLDAALQPVGLGIVGELYVGGAGLAWGYMGRPELTAERFIPNPFLKDEGLRMKDETGSFILHPSSFRLYKTGDLGRWRGAGELEYLGRADQQVKIRGYRIELGEIAAVLLRHADVRTAAVVVRSDGDGGPRLVAYVVADPAPKVGELRRFMQQILPDYMLPSTFVFLEALPLTANGKLDTRALPALGQQRPELDEAYVAPRTAVEGILARIWKEVLGGSQPGVHDNFFVLGGDSIRSVQVVALAREQGLPLTLPDLFQHQTIAGLASCMAAETAREQAAPSLAPFSLLDPADLKRLPPGVVDAYPLAMLQQGMLYHMALTPDRPDYHNVDSSYYRGQLVTALFRAAAQQAVARHPILRTAIDLASYSAPLQLIYPEALLDVTEEDIAHLAPADQEQVIDSFVTHEMRRPFDLRRPPLLRLHVHRRGDDTFQLTITEFHPIMDGWSLNLLLAEIFAGHDALCAGGGAPELPPLRSSYRDFVAYERAVLQSQEHQRYWTEVVRDATITRLPRRQLAGHRPDVCWQHRHTALQLTPALSEQLRQLARHERVPLKSVLLAAHLRVLALLSGQADIMTGLVTHGRLEERDGERVCGLFLNMVPFRLRLGGGTWRALIRQTFAAEQSLLPFRHYPQAAIKRHWGQQEGLFETTFNYADLRSTAELFQQGRLEDLGFTRASFPTEIPLNIVVSLEPISSAVLLKCEWDSAIVGVEQVDMLLEHCTRALQAMVERPDGRYEQADLLAPAEKWRLLNEYNATRQPYPRDMFLPDLVEAQAAGSPDAVAMAFENQQLTYAALNRRANQLAHQLRALGVDSDTPVGLCVERSPELLVGLLGILKAGGAYLPLDPIYPAERLHWMLQDCRPPVLVSQQSLRDTLPHFSGELILLDVDWGRIARQLATSPRRHIQGDHLAYIIYTSGSTGQPKGVQVPHQALGNFLHSMRREPGLSAQDVLLAVTTLSFDIAALELFLPLIVGARVEVASTSTSSDARRLAAALGSSGTTVMQATPATWHMLIESGWTGDTQLRVLCGGEALPHELALQLCRRCASLWNMYGPTETTIWSSISRVASDGTSVTIGCPIANTQLYVLDIHFQPVPLGVPGDLYIGGMGLARGYRDLPSLTSEKFLPNPFSAEPGARMYKTGDLARYMPDGALLYIGRSDHQVKLRGFRIEPGEVEATLRRHAAVREAVVVARADTGGEQRLVAYVVPTTPSTSLRAGDHRPPTTDSNGKVTKGQGDKVAESSEQTHPLTVELRAFLRETLPEYMIPSAFVVLDALPRTPNGKIAARNLPAPEQTRSNEVAYIAPRTPAEDLLAGIWERVLRIAPVGVEDGFYSLGGHSLLAMQILARVRDLFKVDLTLPEFLAAQTIAQLAARLESLRHSTTQPLVPAECPATPALSFGQERLWFLDQLDPANTAYTIILALRLEGTLNVTALQGSLTALVARHEVLRTTFAQHEGRPVQAIAEPGAQPLPLVDLRGLPKPQRMAQIQAQDLARQPFDLKRGPLLRTQLMRLGDDEHLLVLAIHHSVFDAWSIGILYRELGQLYAAARSGQPARLPELPIQYADYAAWQRAWLQSAALEQQLGYWRCQLAGAPPLLTLPTNRPRPAIQRYTGAEVALALAPELVAALRSLSRQAGTTLFMTLLAAFQVLLARYSGQDDVVVGTPIANRIHGETAGLIGFFVNTLALRADLAGNSTGWEVLERVRAMALGGYAHAEVPFEHLVDQLQVLRTMSHTPLFQVLFSLDQTMAAPALDGLRCTPVQLVSTTAKFDLALLLEDRTSGIAGVFEYNTALFDTTLIERMADHFQLLLAGLAAGPDRPVMTLPLLTDAERDQLLRRRVAPPPAVQSSASLHAHFIARAASTPAAVAVVYEDHHLTYSALRQRAEELARVLHAHGVGPDMPVGLLIERSPALIIGILGILQAGGAYLPLDPTYPADRLAFMLQDSGANILLTERALRAILPLAGPHVLCIDALPEATDIALPAASASQLSYIIYTSGSTGVPKGVQVTHANALRLFSTTESWFQFGPRDVWTLFHSIAFDFSVWELWGALLYGGRLVIVPYLVSRDPDAFLTLLLQQGVTVLNQTPTAFRQLQALATSGEPRALALRYIIFGGEALDLASLQPWFARYGQIRPELVNMYGITETTVHVTYRPLTAADASAGLGSRIGVPIPDLELYVLDDAQQLLPVGVPGELYVGGAGLARGYLNRPDLTAERFIPNPFGRLEMRDWRLPESEPPISHLQSLISTGTRLYKTGDLARRSDDGDIEYLGRIDQQIKIRGFRIELGEIAAMLERHPAVREAVIVAREDVPGDTRLVAYVVPKIEDSGLKIEDSTESGHEQLSSILYPRSSDLRAFLKTRLPDYMVPSAFIPLDALPLTASGKLDRRALPAPEEYRPERSFVAARTPVEQVLAQIWAGVLGQAQVGIHDNFFELGGHSLLATRLLAQVRSTFRLDIPIRHLFESPTLADFTQALMTYEPRPGQLEKIALFLQQLARRTR